MHNQMSSTVLNSSPLSFDDLPNWSEDDHRAAFDVFVSSAREMLQTPYRQASPDVDHTALMRCCHSALALSDPSSQQSRMFFEQNFQLCKLEGKGFVTGYFEPVVEASAVCTPQYCYPLYRRPPDLVDLDDSSRPLGMDADCRFGRLENGKVSEYYDRGAIQNGALVGKGLELVWLKDKTDAFFIHVQGSARLELTEGSSIRVAYCAKTGHPYTSLAKQLSREMDIDPALMMADRLADWMRSHPDQIDGFMAQNQSYIFFKLIEDIGDDNGPVGAARIPLVAGRSLAVDRNLHTFGLPLWVHTFEPLPGHAGPFHRLMVAQDTGSAIIGSSRGDIFVGTGSEAGLIAGKIRHDAEMILLEPRQ